MKKIQVFIASSAEMDEDKLQLDLFFSEKNKLYEKRDILFVQKTWKDFESSIHKTFLQDRYDAYIRQCDIVIFLFHTKLGKYTLRELEVAHNTFKSSKKYKPRIFIFYKETGLQDTQLIDFKTFSEQKYGHFCDTYNDYPQLLYKVEKQLQLLENNGYIVPNHFNPQKALKYILFYILLPLLILTSSFAAFYYYKDIDMIISVSEDPNYSIPSLPFKKGLLEIQYGGGEKQTFFLNEEHHEAFIKGIHSKYRGEKTHIRFVADGYFPIDTLLTISDNIQLSIKRNTNLEYIFGTVTNEKGNPLSEAIICVQDLITRSNEAGYFLIRIPLTQQAEEQLLTVYKPGYIRWSFTGPVIPNVPWNIVLSKE